MELQFINNVRRSLPVLSRGWVRIFIAAPLILLFNVMFSPAHAQVITTFAGNPAGDTMDGIPATDADIGAPKVIAVDIAGNIYFGCYACSYIKKISTSGIISTVAGKSTGGFSGDGGPATAAGMSSTYGPTGIASDSLGNIYIADEGNYCIRKVNNAGIITTIAGTPLAPGYSGDGGPATAAKIGTPTGIAADRFGNIYIYDVDNHVIRKVSGGIITTFAGTGVLGHSGDGGPATAAQLLGSSAIAVDSAGNVYFGDSWGVPDLSYIRMVNTSGIITTFAGNGIDFFSGDGGPATAASFSPIRGMAIDRWGNMFLSFDPNLVRVINTSGIVTTYAGNDTTGYSGDGGPAIRAELDDPEGLAVDSLGRLYIADGVNFRIRVVSAPQHGAAVPVLNKVTPQLSIYPNPITNKEFTCNITTNTSEEAKIVINNILGQVVFTTSFTTNNAATISLNVPPGFYFVTAYTATNKMQAKIVVE